MENKVSLILKVFAAIVSVIAIILVGMAASSNSPEVGGLIALTNILFWIAVVAAILIPVIIIAVGGEWKKIIMPLAGFAGLMIVFGIAYGMSTDEVVNGVVVENSRVAEAGIITFYILFFMSIAALAFGAVKKLIK